MREPSRASVCRSWLYRNALRYSCGPAAGVFGLAFAGAAVDHSTVSVVGCGTQTACTGTGTYGNGGEQSGDKAQGGRQITPGARAGVTQITSGNEGFAGRIAVNDNGNVTNVSTGQLG